MTIAPTTKPNLPTLREFTVALLKSQERQKAQESRDEFYSSDGWLRLRYWALQQHGGTCQCCGCRPLRGQLHVDHIKPRSKHPELELERSNVQVLCADCNFGKGNWDETDWRWK